MTHANRAHAKLSPSAAHRWMNCTVSANLEQQFPDTTSEAAREGTLAHEICERKLRGLAWKDLTKHSLYQPEMDHYTDEYVEIIDTDRVAFESDPYMVIEQRLDLSDWIPDGFGTADCILIGDDTLMVIDFKYGKGVPVDAEWNPQMMIYALGAVRRYQLTHKFSRVRMQIVQPRIDHTNEWECSVKDLMDFGMAVKLKASLASIGAGEATPGDWCRFCRARQQCRARADKNVELAFVAGKKPPLITNEEIGQYLAKGRDVSKWLADLEEYALSECLKGHDVPGWKAVEGRANRKFDDVDQAFKVLMDNGIEEALLYERKPVSLTNIEKMLGKKPFEKIVGDHIVKPQGKPTLVPESDKRTAIQSVPSAAAAFQQEE